MARRILNLPEWRAHLLARLRREISLTADPDLQALYEELESYPGGVTPHAEANGDALFVPLRLRSNRRDLAFFSTVATFGTPLDVTLSELSMEAFYPADAATAAVLREVWG